MLNKQLASLFLLVKDSVVNTYYNGAICYLFAIAVLIPTWFEPQMRLPSRVQDTLFVIDISESMNVRDVNYPKPSSSRLDLAKQTVIASMASLPCGSRVSLGLTAGEESVILFEPLETCRHFAAIEQVVSKLDRRARWVGDSKLTDVTIKAIEQAKQRNLNLVLLTDGDEMPRRSSLHMTKLAKYRGEIKGLLIGLGGDSLQPVPKINETGNIIGYWSKEDALTHGNYPNLVAYAHALKRGESIPDGALDGVTEHLSRFNKTIMESLAKASGFQLIRVSTPATALNTLNQNAFQRLAIADRDARWLYSLVALSLFIMGWFWQDLRRLAKTLLKK